MNLFNKIYDLTFSPLLTPYNLIDTLKIVNYHSLNFKKNDIGIIAEITCNIDKENLITFYYEFDEKDFILNLYYYENNKKVFLFNRDEELVKHKEKFNQIPFAI